MDSCFTHWVAMLSFFNAQSIPNLARGRPFKVASMFIIILWVSSYLVTSYFLAQHHGPCSLCTFPALALPASSPRSPGFFPLKIVFRNQYLGIKYAHSPPISRTDIPFTPVWLQCPMTMYTLLTPLGFQHPA